VPDRGPAPADDPRRAAIHEEQQHVDRAYARLQELRQRAQRRIREAMAAPTVTHADLVNRDAAAFQAARRLQSLTLGDEEPLVFGRLDLEDAERHHIGRISVLSSDYDPLVIDWRSDVAGAFYQATPVEPMGVRRRRAIRCRGPEVLDVEDQLLDLDAEPAGDLVGDAALMAALRRQRSEVMHDIVATLQREQDAVIRMPAHGITVVAGGPGTGKTAVALHRVAYLLYKHRERFEHRGVLVIGPTRAFADYIAAVLPSLGETTAVLRPLGAFVPGLETDRHDRRDVAAVKGDPRMTVVVHRYAQDLPDSSGWRSAFERLRAGIVDVRELARDVLPRSAADLLHGAWLEDDHTERIPTVEDVALVDELRTRLAGGRLAPRRAAADQPLAEEVTTHADRELTVDPTEFITDPDYTEFAHVVVDEAQDLSAMQWRMVGRRGAEASWTVVGDLAQRSTMAGPDSWERIREVLDRSHLEVARLTVNYRTPEAFMTFAARLLPHIAADEEPPRSARHEDVAPDLQRGVADLVSATTDAATALRAAHAGTVAVVAPSSWIASLGPELAPHDVRVFDPWTVKGLEFDAVVVADPHGIAEEAGLGALYVALTRATRALTVITEHQRLPDPLENA